MTLALDAVVSLDTPDYDLDGNPFAPPPPVTDFGGTVLTPVNLSPYKKKKRRPKKIEEPVPEIVSVPKMQTIEVRVVTPEDDEEALRALLPELFVEVRADDEEALLLLI